MSNKAWVLTLGTLVLLMFWFLADDNQGSTDPANAAKVCRETRAKVREEVGYGRQPRWTQQMILAECDKGGL